jgi:hypothetical protein
VVIILTAIYTLLKPTTLYPNFTTIYAYLLHQAKKDWAKPEEKEGEGG